jgi:membrane-associated phospholipid phosphatase
MLMTPFERLAVAYFLVVLAATHRSPNPRRGILYVCGAIALIIVARFALPWSARAWLGHVYLVLGYWIPAAFAPRVPNERFERWLARADRWCQARAWHVPGTTGLLELAYLLCYPLVPAAFAIVYAFGSLEDVASFWVAVLGAGYACYITLPWTAARPPRLVAIEPTVLPHAVARVNAAMLGRVSHQLVTFPSGHVAVSIAAAMSVCRVWPEAGAGLGAVAVLIAVAAVAGRYHYAVDVLLGLLVGALVPVVTDSFA